MIQNAINQIDFYKTGHIHQYPKGTEYVYSNFTARSGERSNIPRSKGVVFIGLQLFIKDYLINEWNTSFFNKQSDYVVSKYKAQISKALGSDISADHILALHTLQYLPIKIKALPEGSFVHYKIPLLTITNTLPEFYWLPNYLESVISNELWPMITSATTYFEYMRVFHEYADATGGDKDFIPYQAHDFSFRGMFGREAAAKSAFAAIACGARGTDSLPGVDIAENYYNAGNDIAGSVPATEHSVMSSNIELLVNWGLSRSEAEFETFKKLITEVYPTGNISIVSDTFDFWNVVTVILPRLKDVILKRDGKVIIRPDSGDPVSILCGTVRISNPQNATALDNKYCRNGEYFIIVTPPGELFGKSERYEPTPEDMGLVEMLWKIFGGSVNSKGYKTLDPHIGVIYGDSITLDRQQEILYNLKLKGFSSDNVVLGVGSFSYQMVTRDTHGFAMKATSITVHGKRYDIYKEPKTDSGTKKSAKGLLMVSQVNGKYELTDQCNAKEEARGCLQPIFEDGKLLVDVSLEDVRSRVQSHLENFL